jgi:acyl-coenzyme A thioesterase PaaI-like protein
LKTLNRINPIGLRLEFILEGDVARTEFCLNENHQGFAGYIHEGVIALLIDDGMGWLSRNAAGVSSVTARMDINIHELARVGEPLVMIVKITKKGRRLLKEYVSIERKDGTLLAEGSCLQYITGNLDARVRSS